MKKISRRSFLKVSGTMAAAGALAACGGSSSTSTAASSEAAPSVEAKAVDGLPDMSKETLNFSSDKVGSGSYNMIVAMSKVLEKAGGFQTVNVNPDSPGGMGAPYLFASGNTDLAFINGAPAKWAMEEGTLGKPATSGYAAVIGGLTAVCYINCVSNAFLQKYNVSTIEEIFEQKLPLRIGCSAKGSMDAEGAYLLLEYFGVTEDDLKSWGGSITNQGGDANADAIADGQIDFYIDHTSSASSTMAQITPPVCLASFTAAGIAGASAWKTGWKAFSFAITAFIVPFAFVYRPAILLEGTMVEIIIAYCIVIAATYLLACGIAGYLFRPLKMWERIACYVVAFIFILPSSMSDIIGIAGCALIMAYCFMTGKKNANKAQPA